MKKNKRTGIKKFIPNIRMKDYFLEIYEIGKN